MASKYERTPMIKPTRYCDIDPEKTYYGSKKCSCCNKNFEVIPFDRNIFTWGMQHVETITYDNPNYICSKCKKELNSFITKVLREKKKWEVKE